jgi:hypothetical protein
MKMAIKNYTTTINVNKTIEEIQGILSKHGATAIMTEYDNGNVTGLSFKIMTPRGELGIRLPSNTDRVLQVLKKQKKNNTKVKNTFEQANKVAWRIIKDWIDAQMAILETEMVEMEEIFLPYMINNDGQTLYQAFKNNQLMLGE